MQIRVQLILCLGSATLPTCALAQASNPPMVEPAPQVVMSAHWAGPDRTVRSPIMHQTSRAIMMPGEDMPRPKPVSPGKRAAKRALGAR